jgi:hypothetical protein
MQATGTTPRAEFPVSDGMDGGIGQQGNMPGALDGQRQLSLVLGAVAGNAARNNLTAFRHKKPQRPHILIVYA